MILAGIEMVLITQVPIELMLQLGIGAVSTLVFSGMLVVLGLITWFTPNQHMITGSFAGFIALGALILSNLGGLVIGTLLALAGGGLAFAWRPVARPPRRRRGLRRKRKRDPGQDQGQDPDLDQEQDQDQDQEQDEETARAGTEPLPPVTRSEG